MHGVTGGRSGSGTVRRHAWRIILAAGVVVLGCGVEPTNPFDEGALQGRVTVNGQGRAGASVRAEGASPRIGTTDAGGNFFFDNMVPGSYSIVTTLPEHTCPVASVEIFADNTTQVDVACTQPPATIVVTVTSQGVPVVGASVTISGPASSSATTNASGIATLTTQTPGTYTVSVAATALGLNCPSTTADAVLGETTNVAIVCTPLTGTIRVTATSIGSPVAGATVTLQGPTPGTEVTNANGVATFPNRSPGNYSFTVTRAGFVCNNPGNATAVAGQTVDAAISCTPSG